MSAAVESIPVDQWAATVAARFADRVQPGLRVCVPTGNTPTPFYREVADHTSLGGLTLFLLDEFGGLPEADPGRCLTMLRRDLLDHAEGRPAVLAPEVDAPEPDEAAKRYGDLVADEGLDLAIVGLGQNGHIGMNEPGSTPDMATRVVDLEPSTSSHAKSEYGATEPPTWGITVGLAELMAAREVWVLVTGGHKTDILHRTLHGVVDSEVPASYLTTHANCVFLVDEAAATGESG